jgi:sugar phosphate isomerase/epimerase
VNIDQVALQLYTLRDSLKTPREIAATLKRVRDIGYQAVQVSGLGPIEPGELRAILDGEGLTLCATHESAEEILDAPERVVDKLEVLGCDLSAYPYPRGVDFASEESVRELIQKLDHAGEVLAQTGKTLLYHNHQHEFRTLGGRLILERIYSETDPRHLQGELDTYWVQYGGGDPVAWCKRLSGRLPVLHLKDYRVGTDNQPTFAEIGSGNLNFRAIIAAAEGAGCRWFAVEQDTCEGDPFDSVRESFKYMRGARISS